MYWNSRLQTEHARLVEVISAASSVHPESSPPFLVADLMAGVGPFAVPLALRGVPVYANDLNPRSYESLVQNAKRNKCLQASGADGTFAQRHDASAKRRKVDLSPPIVAGKHHLVPCNDDARAFVLRMAAEKRVFHHAIMNLPQTAVDFLDAFIGLYVRHPDQAKSPPWVSGTLQSKSKINSPPANMT